MDPYEHHKKIYDIIDRAHFLRSLMTNFSRVIDDTNELPNSLQAMLGMIYRYEGKTQSELSIIYKRDEKNVIHYVSDLCKRGLVRKVKEGQKKKLYLTDQGKKINEVLMERRGQLIEDLLESLDAEDLITTRQTLDKIIEVITNRIEKP